MFSNTIPKDLTTETLKERALQGVDDKQLIKWTRTRCTIPQDKMLAEVTRKHLQHMSGMRDQLVLLDQCIQQ